MARPRPLVLFVNEPRAYREAFAAAVAHARPGVRAVATEPERVDSLGEPAPPALLVRSGDDDVERGEGAGVLLSLDEEGIGATVCAEGRCCRVERLDFEGILAVVDRAVSAPV